MSHYQLPIIQLAAQYESERERLMEVSDALEDALKSTWRHVAGPTMRAAAAAAAVALVGRNEGGKTLGSEAVDAVLTDASRFFKTGDHQRQSMMTAALLLPYVKPLRTMAISDANKRLMLQFPGLIDLLIEALILNEDNPRHGQPKAELVQETAAAVLQELALFDPAADVLRAHSGAMKALCQLVECGTTRECQQSAVAALFELDEEQRAKASAAAGSKDDDGTGTGLYASSKPPPHVMMSYNWTHQDVVLRVVTWLQAHGYLVWVDTEQMKGSTVDTMASQWHWLLRAPR